MGTIVKANGEHIQLLADIGRTSFIESHGTSAAPADIDQYASEKYTYEVFQAELSDPKNIYYIVYHDGQPAGYSKIILDATHANIPLEHVTKLERLYLLKEFYSLKLGAELFQFNMDLSKQNNQAGMWLFVWTENHRAMRFYEKAGFKPIGRHDFKLTERHSNPNHQMLLEY